MEYKHILVVDDDSKMRAEIAGQLSAEDGFIIDEAKSGEEAIEKSQHTFYHMYFIDMLLPKKDGIDTCRILRTISPDSSFVCYTSIFDKILSTRITDHIDVDGKIKLIYKPLSVKTFVDAAYEALFEAAAV